MQRTTQGKTSPALEHNHTHALSGAARHRSRLLTAFLLVLAFFGVELIAGLVTGSLALLADAGHMLADVVGLGMALAAAQVAVRYQQRGGELWGQRSFGLYRLEILAALANAVLVLGVAGFVLVEGVRRLGAPHEVPGVTLLVVASVGLVINLISFMLLRPGARESINLRGAMLEVTADALGSVAVIVAAVIITTTGWPYADALFGIGIGLFILPRALRLGREAIRVLVQEAPPDLPLNQISDDLAALPDVVDVHDLHVWTLTSQMEVVSAHLNVCAGGDSHAVLDRATTLLRQRYGLKHATLQVEPLDHEGCEQIAW